MHTHTHTHTHTHSQPQEEQWRVLVKQGDAYKSAGAFEDAAFKFCQAARTCRMTGTGDLSLCLEKAAATYYALATALQQLGMTWPALAASECCLERAQQAGSPHLVVWSVVLCAEMHCVRAVQLSRPSEYESTLEVLLPGLQQATAGIPYGVSVTTLDRLLRLSAWVLHNVSQQPRVPTFLRPVSVCLLWLVKFGRMPLTRVSKHSLWCVCDHAGAAAAAAPERVGAAQRVAAAYCANLPAAG